MFQPGELSIGAIQLNLHKILEWVIYLCLALLVAILGFVIYFLVWSFMAPGYDCKCDVYQGGHVIDTQIKKTRFCQSQVVSSGLPIYRDNTGVYNRCSILEEKH